MVKSIDIINKLSKITTRMSMLNQQPRDYGTGITLYASEIHTIKAIEEKEGLNITELANVMGVTKGAISKIINKLVRKGLVEKYKDANNKKEVLLKLTDEGEDAYIAHAQFHHRVEQEVGKYFDELENIQKEHLLESLTILDSILSNHCNKGCPTKMDERD
ncbi:MarR family winged helix-turn-helix transcriptional regulator [Vallitalea okinawensis]|uniref:MarR family winged helix-turn-helix transcriptional regulator n=1 Tax=Vallitalea okinawensis TaxID=2078660 RepID=UPI001300398A|nr:MarR family transcriptional regulator [Vallitalea okinawensis]